MRGNHLDTDDQRSEQPVVGVSIDCGQLRRMLPSILASSQDTAAKVTEIMQLVRGLGNETRAEWDAANAAALIELISRIQTSDEVRQACYRLVHAMQEYLGCQRVAIGQTARGDCRCRLQAISGIAEFDRRTDLVRAIEEVLSEAIVRDEVTIWPAPRARRPATLGHDNLATLAGARSLVSAPLKDAQGNVVGAWVFLDDKSLAQDERRLNMIQAAGPHIGSCLHLVRRNQSSRVTRMAGRVWRRRGTWQARVAIALAIVLLAGMLVPVPYRVACDVQIQPVAQRFVAAPFSGILQQTLCRPGEVVRTDQVLAKLDGRELRWELAGLVAEHQRADKQRQVALATHETATAQQAELTMQRLAAKMELIEYRSEHLEIKSPIDGVVIRGDLKEAVGMPVEVGQTLFEIGPLGRMRADVAIPDTDIRYVTTGCRVKLRLDADPLGHRESALARIHPAAEVLDGKNVFVGEAPLDNADGVLRPGMAGRATIVGPRRPLVWNLFHKPWYYAVQAIGG